MPKLFSAKKPFFDAASNIMVLSQYWNLLSGARTTVTSSKIDRNGNSNISRMKGGNQPDDIKLKLVEDRGAFYPCALDFLSIKLSPLDAQGILPT